MTNVLVTGGCGRIGRRLVLRLLDEGDNITIVDTKEGDIKGVKYVVGDLRDLKKLEGIQVVYHLAALIDYKASNDDLRKANVEPTAHLLSLCEECQQFIFMSSTSVYDESAGPLTEYSKVEPYTKYGWSKLSAEQLVKESGKTYTIIRSSQVYGPEFERGYSAVLKRIQDKNMKIFGHGKNFIPMVHINDLIDALILVKNNEHAYNQIFNVDGGHENTQNEFMEIAAKILGVTPPLDHVSPAGAKLYGLFTGKRANIVEYIDKLTKNRKISIEKIKKLGYEPKVSLDEGMKEVIEEFKKKGILK